MQHPLSLIYRFSASCSSPKLCRWISPTISLFLFIFSVGLRSWAAVPGSIDPTFDPGLGINPIAKSIPVRVVFPLADGSLLIGGIFTNYNGTPRTGLAKILDTGELDQTFVPDPALTAAQTEVWSICQQSDGKVIIAGTDLTGLGARIVRLNDDGSIDPTFTFPKRQASFGMAVSVRPDGLIAYLSDDNFGVGLLNPDGSRLLTSGGLSKPFGLFGRIRISPEGHTYYSSSFVGLFRFGHSFGLPDDVNFTGGVTVTDFDLQSNGTIIVGTDKGGLSKFSSNGLLDTTYHPNLSAKDIEAVVVQPDDKVLIGGTFTTVNYINRRNLARLNADGTTDTNFVTGAGPNSTVYSIAPIASGKAYIAGAFTSYDGLSRTGLARIFLDAPAPPTIVTPPISTNLFEGHPLRLSVAVNATAPITYQWQKEAQPIPNATNAAFYIPSVNLNQAGAYTVEINTPGGVTTSLPANVVINPAPHEVGLLDLGFGVGEGANQSISACQRLADGRFVIAGNFFSFDGKLEPPIVRLNSDGTLDESFYDGVQSSSVCTSLAPLSDGAILAGFSVSSSPRPLLVLLNADGSSNGSFFTAALTDISTIAPLADGKILVGGGFNSIGGTIQTRLARLNPDCSIDLSFNANALQLTKVYALAVQTDGKVIVGDQKRLLRLNDDGSADVDLPLTTSGSEGVRTVVLQTDGKILVGGRFTAIGAVVRTNLARLNTDMTIDTDFTAPAGASSGGTWYVRSLAIQPDQKIVVGGTFPDLARTSRTNLGRLLPNGAIDTTFQPDVGFEIPSAKSAVNTLSLDQDGMLTFGGLFSRVNGSTRNAFARISAFTPPLRIDATLSFSTSGDVASIKLFLPSDPSAGYTLEYTDTLPPNWQPLPNVPNNTNAVEIPFTGSQRFFRLMQQ